MSVTSAPLSGRWEREAERGLGRVGVELDAHVARLRAEDGETRRRVLADLGRTGVDLVFCVGSGFEAMLYAEVEAYPATRYVLLPGSAGDFVSAIGTSVVLAIIGSFIVAMTITAALAGIIVDALRWIGARYWPTDGKYRPSAAKTINQNPA